MAELYGAPRIVCVVRLGGRKLLVHLDVLQKVVVSVEVFVTQGVCTFEGFLMCMDGTNMAFQMFATVEAFSTVFDLADIHSSVLRVDVAVVIRKPRGHTTTTAFLSQVGDGNGERGARP